MAYYDHRHRGIYETNILQAVNQAEGETILLRPRRKPPKIYCDGTFKGTVSPDIVLSVGEKDLDTGIIPMIVI